ncbi:MAG: Scr1 family TA system antitoxin-like transcriptional regulator, partial [Mycobacteriales bacterium]
MSRSPVVSRRRLGSELRSLRDAANKKIEDAAQALECSPAKISRLENGKGLPRTRDVRDLASLYGPEAEARLPYLLELAVEGQGEDWWSDYRDVLQGEMFAEHLLRYIALERDAASIKTFQSDLVPGLLQTEEYIAARCALLYPDQPKHERDRYVDFRKKRQDVVWEAASPPQLSVILSE